MTVQSILNFIQIGDRIATGGQPTEEQLQAARDEGYTAVVNLAPHDEHSNYLPDEESLLNSFGMTYHHIPVAWTEPRLSDFRTFCALMDELAPQKTLVHCAANYRVTAFYSLYAMKAAGWSEAEAQALRDRVWESRPDYSMDETWRTFVAQAQASLAS